MPTLPSSRPASVEPAPRHDRRVPLRLLAAGVGLAVLVPVGVKVAGWLPDEPFGQEVVDRSTTPLLLALEDLHEYHAATGTFQVVVDREVTTRYVPSVISGERVEFLATGTADAYVDFADLDAGTVTLSADGTSATIALPAPRVGEVRIDPEESPSSTATGAWSSGSATRSATIRSTTASSTRWPRTSWPRQPRRATCGSAPRPTPAPC
jgi:hypothetical protein